jgi:hypothetical protein
MQLRLLSLALLVVSGGICTASQMGTFDVSDIKGLLEQKSMLWRVISDDFDIYPVGVARSISRTESIQLNGTRVGPYSLSARPKGKDGPYAYRIYIETKPSFYDTQRRRVSMGKASVVKEEVTSIRIEPLPPEKYFTPEGGREGKKGKKGSEWACPDFSDSEEGII